MALSESLARWVSYTFDHVPVNAALFQAAFTHRSAGPANNERLEFLGDAVLNLITAHTLFERFPDADEGCLSRVRARIVSGESLARVASELGLGELLVLGPGELKTGGFRRESILADALEALCGALFLDGGLEVARRGILRVLDSTLEQIDAPVDLKDPKTRLQEWLQGQGLPLPRYSVQSIEGELHAQMFRVTCEVEPIAVRAQGEGSSRRRAEQVAAARVLEQIHD